MLGYDDLVFLVKRSNVTEASIDEILAAWSIEPSAWRQLTREFIDHGAESDRAAGDSLEQSLATSFFVAFTLGYMARLEVETREAATAPPE